MQFLSPIDNVEDFSTGTFAASFTPDISSSAIVKVTLTGNITSLNAPTGRNFGIFTIVFVQDATGSRTVTWNTTDYPAFSIGSWQPSDVANSISSISLLWDSASSKWRPFSSWNGSLLTGNIYIGKNGASTIQMAGTFVASDLRTNGTIQSNTFQGDTASGGNLNLLSTTHATKGKIYLGGGGNNSAFDETNKRLGIGNVSPSTALDVTGAGTFSSTVTAADPTASTHLATKAYVDKFGGIATNTSTITISSSTSETSAVNVTIPANTLVAGSTYSITATGYSSRTTTSSLVTTKVTVGAASTGGTAIASVAPTASTTAGTNVPFYLTGQFTVLSTGASGTINGGFTVATNAAQGILNAGTAAMAGGTSNTTIDTTSSRVLSLTFTPNSTTLTINITSASITKVE